MAPDAVFSFVHNGHDSALCRHFGLSAGWQAGVAHLARASIHKTDVGRVSCLSADGAPLTRYFLGGASFGLSASIARSTGPGPHRAPVRPPLCRPPARLPGAAGAGAARGCG